MAYVPAMQRYGPLCTYTVSARGKTAAVPEFRFLRRHFGFLALAEIDSLFDFAGRAGGGAAPAS
jgi:hypothetical protein